MQQPSLPARTANVFVIVLSYLYICGERLLYGGRTYENVPYMLWPARGGHDGPTCIYQDARTPYLFKAHTHAQVTHRRVARASTHVCHGRAT
jgi:hypothetical protein